MYIYVWWQTAFKQRKPIMSVLNILCPICTEPFRNLEDIYSTSCGHVFHLQCMREWQCRSSSCPQCHDYKPLTHKLYLSFDENAASVKELRDSLEKSSKEINELKQRLYERNIVLVQDRCESEKEIGELKKLITNLKGKIVCLEGSTAKQRQQIFSLTQEITNLEALSETAVSALNKEIDTLKKDLENINTEYAMEVSRNVHLSECGMQQEAQLSVQLHPTSCEMNASTSKNGIANMSTNNGPGQIIIYKDKIAALEQKLQHISAELENEVTMSTQLHIDKMKLQNFIDCIKSNSSSSPNINDQVSYSNGMKEPILTSPSSDNQHSSSQGSNRRDIQKQAQEQTSQIDEYASTINSIIIKNFPSQNLLSSLENTVMFLAKNMDIYLKKNDIDRVNVVGGSNRILGDRVSLFVKFKTKDMKTTFLESKGKLSKSSSTFLRGVQIKEFIDQRIQDLFLHAKNELLDNGFSSVFMTNNQILAKRDISDSRMIHINTYQQVNELLNNPLDSME